MTDRNDIEVVREAFAEYRTASLGHYPGQYRALGDAQDKFEAALARIEARLAKAEQERDEARKTVLRLEDERGSLLWVLNRASSLVWHTACDACGGTSAAPDECPHLVEDCPHCVLQPLVTHSDTEEGTPT